MDADRIWPSSAAASEIEERKTRRGLVSRVRGRENVCIPVETLWTTRGVLARDDSPSRPDAISRSIRDGEDRASCDTP